MPAHAERCLGVFEIGSGSARADFGARIDGDGNRPGPSQLRPPRRAHPVDPPDRLPFSVDCIVMEVRVSRNAVEPGADELEGHDRADLKRVAQCDGISRIVFRRPNCNASK